MALIEITNYSLVAAIVMGRKGREDKLLATLLSTTLEETTAQQSSLLTNWCGELGVFSHHRRLQGSSIHRPVSWHQFAIWENPVFFWILTHFVMLDKASSLLYLTYEHQCATNTPRFRECSWYYWLSTSSQLYSPGPLHYTGWKGTRCSADPHWPSSKIKATKSMVRVRPRTGSSHFPFSSQ